MLLLSSGCLDRMLRELERSGISAEEVWWKRTVWVNSLPHLCATAAARRTAVTPKELVPSSFCLQLSIMYSGDVLRVAVAMLAAARKISGISRSGNNEALLRAGLAAVEAAIDKFGWAPPTGAAGPPLPRLRSELLPPAHQLAGAVQALWQRPEAQQEQQLEAAQAAATRSCAYLRCANLGGEGGPAGGEGVGSKRCR